MIELVVFDMAGTTVHDEDFVHQCFKAAFDSAGIEVSRDEINDVMGLRKPDAIEQVLNDKLEDKSKITREYILQLHDIFLKGMLNFYATDDRVKEIDGASEAFRTLRANGVKVALDTGFSRDIADTIVKRLSWTDAIDGLIGSDEVENARPAADMIKVLMKQLDVDDPQKIAKVGDTPADLNEGKNAGCGLTFGVLSGACTREELEPHHHDYLVESIADIPEIVLSAKKL